MANSYTTQFFRVSNGDITTHNPKELVGASGEINILSAEIQWEGVTTSEQVTETNYETNEVDTGYGPDALGETPPVPSGYTFNQHSAEVYVRNPNSDTRYYEVNISAFSSSTKRSGNISSNSTELVGEIFDGTNLVGDDVASVFAQDSDPGLEVRLVLGTQGFDTVTTTEYYDTRYPRVTRDVSADSFEVLNDDELSDWVTLSGLAPDEEEFYHDIDGSGEARFRFRFDWQQAYPDAVSQLRVYDAGADVIHKVALADPADTQLDYDHVRVSEGGTTYAVDVVDPSETDALSWFKIQTHKGVVSPRAFDQVSV